MKPIAILKLTLGLLAVTAMVGLSSCGTTYSGAKPISHHPHQHGNR